MMSLKSQRRETLLMIHHGDLFPASCDDVYVPDNDVLP